MSRIKIVNVKKGVVLYDKKLLKYERLDYEQEEDITNSCNLCSLDGNNFECNDMMNFSVSSLDPVISGCGGVNYWKEIEHVKGPRRTLKTKS